MFSTNTKRLLKNAIRQTDLQNRMVEESQMWKSHQRKNVGKHTSDSRRESPPRRGTHRVRGIKIERLSHSPPMRSSCRVVPRAHMDREDELVKQSYPDREEKKSTFWMRKFVETEEKNPERWGHSGYRQLYPDQFRRTPSYTSSDPESDVQVSPKRKKSKHKKSKKKKKKKKKKSHKSSKDKSKSDSKTSKKSSDKRWVEKDDTTSSKTKIYGFGFRNESLKYKSKRKSSESHDDYQSNGLSSELLESYEISQRFKAMKQSNQTEDRPSRSRVSSSRSNFSSRSYSRSRSSISRSSSRSYSRSRSPLTRSTSYSRSRSRSYSRPRSPYSRSHFPRTPSIISVSSESTESQSSKYYKRKRYRLSPSYKHYKQSSDRFATNGTKRKYESDSSS